jgi:uncharacterized protein (TIGR03437 family)
MGNGSAGFDADLGRPEQAIVNYPYGLTTDPRGNLYVADLLNYRVRKARFEYSQDRPATTQEAVVNAASFRRAIAGGGLISVFGRNFGYGQTAAASIPLPLALAGTSVMINGRPAPLIFSSQGQINAQLPWIVNSPVRLRVNFGGVESEEISVPVSSPSPGIFTYGENRAVVQNQDYSLNSAGNAAARGSIIIVYATGLGAVTPSQTDGAAAPVSPQVRTSSATTVLIGGIPARVVFSGLTPGLVGLWQVNAEVPAAAPTGEAIPIRISVQGVDSNEAVISVR